MAGWENIHTCSNSYSYSIQNSSLIINHILKSAEANMDYIDLIQKRTDQVLELAYKLYPQFRNYSFKSEIVNSVNNKNWIACASYSAAKIKYINAYVEADISFILKEIVPHEIAHLVAEHLYTRYGRSIMPHGKEWRAIAISLGSVGKASVGSPKFMELSLNKKRKVKYYEYVSLNQTFLVSQTMHNRILNGSRRYSHRFTGLLVTPEHHTGRVVIK